MDVFKEPWYQNKLTSIFGIVTGSILLFGSISHLDTAQDYSPLPQQVFTDTYNRPIGNQDLMRDTFHNMDYEQGPGASPSKDFLHETLLSFFNYGAKELLDGTMLNRFEKACSEDIAFDLYSQVFLNLNQQEIVKEQDAVVVSQVIGDIEQVKSGAFKYKTTSGINKNALTFQFRGVLKVVVMGQEDFTTVYRFEALVQRAMIQDKMRGYQLIDLEML